MKFDRELVLGKSKEEMFDKIITPLNTIVNRQKGMITDLLGIDIDTSAHEIQQIYNKRKGKLIEVSKGDV